MGSVYGWPNSLLLRHKTLVTNQSCVTDRHDLQLSVLPSRPMGECDVCITCGLSLGRQIQFSGGR